MRLNIVICITFIGVVKIQVVENMGLSCGRNQNCIRYSECPSALKISRGILSAVNDTEKQMLVEKFRQMQCGNYSSEKTVCCDQVDGEGKT